MLDHLAVLVEAKDVDTGVIAVAWPLLMAVQDHVIAIGEGPLDLRVLARVVMRHPLEILDEGLFAVGAEGVVLPVVVTHEPIHRFTRLRLVEHQVVERDGIPPVPLLLPSHGLLLAVHLRRRPVHQAKPRGDGLGRSGTRQSDHHTDHNHVGWLGCFGTFESSVRRSSAVPLRCGIT